MQHLPNFNPRSREGSDALTKNIKRLVEFQSTLPRRERHIFNLFLCQHGFISIHAPAKGATDATRRASSRPEISIHAPAKGATGGKLLCVGRVGQFQSTLPRRERRLPAWQGTARCHFNPRSREGSDLHRTAAVYCMQANFNPRSREGSDLPEFACYQVCYYFNPRSREGSDPMV